MTMTIYKSTDPSAPALPSVNGSMINVLYQCLVTGYGSKAGAGWTRPFTGTNLAAFKQGAGGNNRYLRVFDGGFSTGNSLLRRINIRGYESMTAISTGTNPFPTTSQVNGNGSMCSYYYTGSAVTNAAWTVYATSNFFLVHTIVYENGSDTKYNMMFGFGRFKSRLAGDIFNDILIGGGPDANGVDFGGFINQTSQNQVYVSRSDTGVVGSQVVTLKSVFNNGHIAVGHPDYPYPDRVTNSLSMARVQVWVDGYYRGTLPALWDVAHPEASIGPDGTTWSGNGALAGKTFVKVSRLSPINVGQSYPAVETSDTWE